MGVFQGDVEGLICPVASYSCTNSKAAVNFIEERGHWSTQTGASLFQVILSACSAGEAMALMKNFETLALSSQIFECQQAGSYLVYFFPGPDRARSLDVTSD